MQYTDTAAASFPWRFYRTDVDAIGFRLDLFIRDATRQSMNPHKSNRARLGWFFLCLSILFAARLPRHRPPPSGSGRNDIRELPAIKSLWTKMEMSLSRPSSRYWNGAIIKYSGAGAPLWTNIWGAYGSKIQDMALDQNGNVYVTGFGEYLLMTPPDYITTA